MVVHLTLRNIVFFSGFVMCLIFMPGLWFIDHVATIIMLCSLASMVVAYVNLYQHAVMIDDENMDDPKEVVAPGTTYDDQFR